MMRMRPLMSTLLGGVLVVSALGCKPDRQPGYDFLPWLNYMMFSSAAETNTKNVVFKNGQTNQVPPEGTIPRGFQPLHFTVDEAGRDQAGRELKNPYDPTPGNLERGAVMFKTFCTPCHGLGGAGDGLVAKRGVGMTGFPINAADAGPGTWPDGRIFHMITYGRKDMPSYAAQIAPEDRWKIILHVRELQKANKGSAGAPAPAAAPATP
jgi:mono/diheme cytochrome c family protein